MSAEHGYCSKCGTPLAVKWHAYWEENTSAIGPAGRWIDRVYCPHCEAIEEEKKRKREEEEARKKREKEEKERRERHSEYLKRLEKYKKYMPKKVTAIVLTYQEAKHLRDMVQKEIYDFNRKKEVKDDNLYIDKVLIEKLSKAYEETDYAYGEVGEFAKEKGWEKDDSEVQE